MEQVTIMIRSSERFTHIVNASHLVAVSLQSAGSAELVNNERTCYTMMDSTQFCLSMPRVGANSSEAALTCMQQKAPLMRS
jgi:hypothetical protein